MKPETALAIVGAATILLLLYRVRLDGLEKQRLGLECERYKRQIQRLTAAEEHQGKENQERGKWLGRFVDLVAACLKGFPALA